MKTEQEKQDLMLSLGIPAGFLRDFKGDSFTGMDVEIWKQKNKPKIDQKLFDRFKGKSREDIHKLISSLGYDEK